MLLPVYSVWVYKLITTLCLWSVVAGHELYLVCKLGFRIHFPLSQKCWSSRWWLINRLIGGYSGNWSGYGFHLWNTASPSTPPLPPPPASFLLLLFLARAAADRHLRRCARCLVVLEPFRCSPAFYRSASILTAYRRKHTALKKIPSVWLPGLGYNCNVFFPSCSLLVGGAGLEREMLLFPGGHKEHQVMQSRFKLAATV